MSRSLCLTRQCLGMVTRIECVVLPLAGGNGLWTLICAAGLSGEQPTAIKAQGPFCGPLVAEGVLAGIADNLIVQGYCECCDLPIWRLHIQAQLRQLNGERRRNFGDYQFHPET
ncbi:MULTISPECIES: hypothetical protein [Pseudomonas]|uniref:PA4575 family protein n=1 Tax=Pseudomonas TaxID=286 RepID=UPI000854A998|nr:MULTISPECIES: hypothetical protein [Pseudomonas]MBQ57081.1 hypothetical protein [Pseudomonadaceae bacterium]NRH27175.1 hypothetical protein [Pseudomonas sp. MS19]OEO27190.1 hypothetical protein AX279_02605 [Pseudomonas sp. J237]SFT62947.1 hypothetical protein SAMN05216264_102151 [Pseudomonas marincola]HCP56207.1 hypothetical protein [Pseudomonas sp.]